MPSVASKIIIAAGALTLGFAVSGCAQNESLLYIEAVLHAEAPDCVYKPDPSSTSLIGGTYDIGFGHSYYAGLLIGNQLAHRGQRERFRTETARVTLEGVEVRLLDNHESEISFFTSPGAGFVDVGSGEESGYGVVGASIIPSPSLVQSQQGRFVIAELRAFGHTLGGSDVESDVFRFPIDVCRGCLVSFSQDLINPATGECNSSSTDQPELPCQVGQDDVLPCTACVASYPEICLSPP